MSRVGKCIDNGPMEGFWGTLKCEIYHRSHFETYEELVVAVKELSITITTSGASTSSTAYLRLHTAAYWKLHKKPGPHS